MPRRYTLSDLRTRCQQRADRENDDHIAEAEWNSILSEVYGDLFSIVVDAGYRYFETTHTITADGSASYDEPDDHLTTLGIDLILDAAGRRRPLEEATVQERHIYAGQTGEARAWALVDDQLVLYPKPSSGTYEVLYTPQSPDLSSYVDADLIDVVSIYGEVFLLHGVAAIALAKSESDVRFHLARQERAGQKLLEWAAQRNLVDSRRRFVGDAGGGNEGDWNR